jgi:hypothetical protein
LRNILNYFSEWSGKQVDVYQLCLSPAGRTEDSLCNFTQEHNEFRHNLQLLTHTHTHTHKHIYMQFNKFNFYYDLAQHSGKENDVCLDLSSFISILTYY